MTLFRPESLHSQRQVWLGSIHVMRPPGLGWLALWALTMLVVVSAFLFWAETGRRVQLDGVLMPEQGLIRIVPPVAGTVLKAAVQEGQSVRAGEPLLILWSEVPGLGKTSQLGLQETFDARQRSLADASNQTLNLRGAREAALKERLDALGRELSQLDAQSTWQQQRLQMAQQSLARLEALGRAQYVSEQQIQARAEEVLGLKADLATSARQREALQRELAGVQADVKALPLQTAQQLGELDRQRAEINELSARAASSTNQRELVVRAPFDGVVSAFNASPGQALSPDRAVAMLTPAHSALLALVYANSASIGLIRVGQPVRLRIQAFPYQQFGWVTARVLRVAQAPMLAADLADVPLASVQAAREPLYRIALSLDRSEIKVGDALQPLLPGMTLQADVQVDKRRLIDWMFAPLKAWSAGQASMPP